MSIIEKKKKEKKEAEPKDFKKNKISKDKTFLVISEPVITEKSSLANALSKYVFKVANSANKTEVKKAIEGFYGVNVVSVNMLKTAPKTKRVGRGMSTDSGYKKAIVTLKSGEVIEENKK